MFDARMIMAEHESLAKAVGTTYSDVLKIKGGHNYVQVFFEASITKSCVGVGASLQIKLQHSDDGTLWVDFMTSPVVPVANLSVGKMMIQDRLPIKIKTHFRLAYVVTGGAITSGTIFAGFEDAINVR